MKYNELTMTANKKSTRVGRGIAAGRGKTAGRGTKGQNARTGGGVRPGFEGGQNPLMNRIPKLRGFRAVRPKAEVVYTSRLNNLGATADNAAFAKAGITTSEFVRVKIVLNGDVTKKVAVSTQGASKTAVEAIKKAGGSFTQVTTPQRQKTSSKKADK
jgi:large subunit ribosomal protein L15